MNDVVEQIRQFNAGREAERLALKLGKMRADPFAFLRGSCHRFYATLPEHAVFATAPAAWICGDLHLENFGSYKGDNRLVYFDLNDFDEAALAPCTWDLLRFLVSLRSGLELRGTSPDEIAALARNCVAAYAAALATGKARWIERETASGPIRDLLDGLRQRSRGEFLDGRSERKGKNRQIRCDGRKALPASAAQRAAVETFLNDFAATTDKPDFFAVLDVARRIAGTGSLGLERYVVLVAGKGSPDGNYLLDLKQAIPSSLQACSPLPQPAWGSEAERIVTLQGRLQAIPMAFLHAVELAGHPFVLRDLQPSEDRVALPQRDGKTHRLGETLAEMARLAAWAHLRGSGRGGSANADALVDFGQRQDWRQPLLDLSGELHASVVADWQRFAAAYDRGEFS